jgi:hypothetical protein
MQTIDMRAADGPMARRVSFGRGVVAEPAGVATE